MAGALSVSPLGASQGFHGVPFGYLGATLGGDPRKAPGATGKPGTMGPVNGLPVTAPGRPPVATGGANPPPGGGYSNPPPGGGAANPPPKTGHPMDNLPWAWQSSLGPAHLSQARELRIGKDEQAGGTGTTGTGTGTTGTGTGTTGGTGKVPFTMPAGSTTAPPATGSVGSGGLNALGSGSLGYGNLLSLLQGLQGIQGLQGGSAFFGPTQ